MSTYSERIGEIIPGPSRLSGEVTAGTAEYAAIAKEMARHGDLSTLGGTLCNCEDPNHDHSQNFGSHPIKTATTTELPYRTGGTGSIDTTAATTASEVPPYDGGFDASTSSAPVTSHETSAFAADPTVGSGSRDVEDSSATTGTKHGGLLGKIENAINNKEAKHETEHTTINEETGAGTKHSGTLGKAEEAVDKKEAKHESEETGTATTADDETTTGTKHGGLLGKIEAALDRDTGTSSSKYGSTPGMYGGARNAEEPSSTTKTTDAAPTTTETAPTTEDTTADESTSYSIGHPDAPAGTGTAATTQALFEDQRGFAPGNVSGMTPDTPAGRPSHDEYKDFQTQTDKPGRVSGQYSDSGRKGSSSRKGSGGFFSKLIPGRKGSKSEKN